MGRMSIVLGQRGICNVTSKGIGFRGILTPAPGKGGRGGTWYEWLSLGASTGRSWGACESAKSGPPVASLQTEWLLLLERALYCL